MKFKTLGLLGVSFLFVGCAGGGAASNNSAPITRTIGGTVSALSGTGLVLQDNGGNSISISANGNFTFNTAIASGGSYSVTVSNQPTSPSQTCVVTSGSGTASANVTNVQVTCTINAYTIGGTISGLSGAGLVLQDNVSDSVPVNANGSFTFTKAIASGGSYSVTVFSQPTSPAQTCVVTSDGSGALSSSNVTNVLVTCTTNPYTVGGTVSGLTGNGLVLQDNGGNNLAVLANGSFTFTASLASGTAYSVTAFSQPSNPTQTCIVISGSGSLSSSNVTNVLVSCTTNTYTIGGTISGLSGAGLVLQDNGGSNLPVIINGSFTFTTALSSGGSYNVTVLTQPSNPAQTCGVTSSSGTASANVTNVQVTCTTNTNNCPNNANFSGGYAMMIRGIDTAYYNGSEGAVGSFLVDGNGNITQGMMDINGGTIDVNAPGGELQTTFRGTYCLASNNLGTMTLNMTFSLPAYSEQRTLAFSLQSDGNGNIITHDCCSNDGLEGSGMLRKQQTSAFSTGEIIGSYAFGFLGYLDEAGVLTCDGNGNITSGEYDLVVAGGDILGTITGGVYNVASNSRGTATVISTASTPVKLVFYVVSSSEVLFLQVDGQVVAGQALLQSGPFSNSSLNGNSVIGIEEGQAEVEAGLFTADGSGSFTLSVDDNAGGTVTSNTGGGEYTVASNGRVTLSNVTWCMQGSAQGCEYNPVFYLVSKDKAFIVGTDGGTGKMEPQSGSNFTNASLNGNFTGGSEDTLGPAVGEEVDSLNFDGIGTITGISYQNGPDSNFAYSYYSQSSPSSGPISGGTYSVSSKGRVVVANTNQETIIYMISTSKFVATSVRFGNTGYFDGFPYLMDFGQ